MMVADRISGARRSYVVGKHFMLMPESAHWTEQAHDQAHCNLDCTLMDSGPFSEFELRAHVRSLLLEYALQHLTTNYVTWTQETVTKVRI